MPPRRKRRGDGASLERARTFHATSTIREMVNAALYLRRPLLVTGKAGSGKSSLVEAVAYELRLGHACCAGTVTSRSTLTRRALPVRRDRPPAGRPDARSRGASGGAAWRRRPARGRPTASALPALGPLGTALLPTRRPRALLIDEIDKSDIDLPNDLLNVFEEGEFDDSGAGAGSAPTSRSTVIDRRTAADATRRVTGGRVRCHEFPFHGAHQQRRARVSGAVPAPLPAPARCPTRPATAPRTTTRAASGCARSSSCTSRAATSRTRESVIEDFIDVAVTKGRDVATDQLLNAVYFMPSASRRSRTRSASACSSS